MRSSLPVRLLFIVIAFLFVSLAAAPALAQTDPAFGDSADPLKLFEQGQRAHAKGDFDVALEFYEEAIKLRPNFPEAELQRGHALFSKERFDEAEKAYRRAIELRPSWAQPYAALGNLLSRTAGKEQEAEQTLRRALALEQDNYMALSALASLRFKAGDAKEAAQWAQRATADADATASAWTLRGMAEHKLGNKNAATESLDRALELDSRNLAALIERAELRTDSQDYERAAADLGAALKLRPADKDISARLFNVYQKAGKMDEAARVASAAGLNKVTGANNKSANGVTGTAEEIEAANGDDPQKALPIIEKLLERNPQNAMLHARRGWALRTTDPAQSLQSYRRAVEIEPANPKYAAGYAAALVQARRFEEAAAILQRVVKADPDDYAAHANLATAFHESKQYKAAIEEYQWLLQRKPDLAIAYFFIATDHDKLGEYPEALAAYENFLTHADASVNQLEIEKVKLRLPSLRNQIKLGEGAKRKKQD